MWHVPHDRRQKTYRNYNNNILYVLVTTKVPLYFLLVSSLVGFQTQPQWVGSIRSISNCKQLTEVYELLHWQRGRRVLWKPVHLFRDVQLWAVLQHDLRELHVDLQVKSTDLEMFPPSFRPGLIRCRSQSLTFRACYFITWMKISAEIRCDRTVRRKSPSQSL